MSSLGSINSAHAFTSSGAASFRQETRPIGCSLV
jgi:hypothetical protein